MKPDTGYDGLSQATASIVLQEKAATLKTSAQNITPDSGKLLSKVSVPAVPGNAALTNVLAGKTFSSETAGVGKTGAMANKAGTTVKASAISQDDNNTYLTIPAAGYYDVTSKVYTENSNLGNKEPVFIGQQERTISGEKGPWITFNNNKKYDTFTLNISSGHCYLCRSKDGTTWEKMTRDAKTMTVTGYEWICFTAWDSSRFQYPYTCSWHEF